MTAPTLAIVSGSPGTGKTTLAHGLARELGCPAVIRDEIKQGMVMSTPGYRAGGEDRLNLSTLDAFFGVLRVLLRAKVTVVAEAAYQDRLWRPNLTRLADLAQLRVIRCTTPAAVAHHRIVERARQCPHRSAHADDNLINAIATGERSLESLESFTPITLDAAKLTVDTTSGYNPGLPEIAAFVRASAAGQSRAGETPDDRRI